MSWKLSLRFRYAVRASVVLFVAFLGVSSPYGQGLPAEVEQLGYADYVFLDGKVISMDDVSISTSPGHIYQAIAVKGDKIMKLGTTDEIKALAGRITKVYDLNGKPQMPGIVEPHQHIYGGALRYADRFGIKFPPNGIVVEATADKDLEKTQAILRDALKDAVKKVNKGDWIVLNMNANPGDPRALATWGYTRRLTNRKTLDMWTPENPVLVRPGNRGNVNSKALEVLNELLPGYSASINETMHGVDIGEDIPAIGWVGSQEMGVITWEVFLAKVPPSTLAQMLKLTSEDWAALGVTTVATRLPFPKIMSGYSKLAELGQMPIRLDVHYEVHRMPTEPKETRQLYRRTGVLQGIGSDYMWYDGVASERWDSHYPETCMGPDTKAPPNLKARETCPHPGDLHWDVLTNAIKSGWRLAGVHTVGSEALRRMAQMVEGARVAAGMSMDEIREGMFTLEHCDMLGKLPDTIELLKKYNFMISCGPNYISEGRVWAKDMGPMNPNIGDFLEPFNTWIKSGVNIVGQHFGGGARRGGEGGVGNGLQPPFFMLWQAITRKYDGKVWQPDERIDRVHALKMWTSWSSRYVRKPDKLGTLEKGKWADLLIIDRDYLTVPVDDILKIRPLMTMVGGRMAILNASLAKEWNTQPIGSQYNFDDKDVAWIGQPLSDEAKEAAAAGRE